MASVLMLKSKVHRATVTQADVHYVGSLTLDQGLMDAAGLLPYERVEVADVSNGERLATYIIPGERGSGILCMNGAAALKIGVGDLVIIFAYCQVPQEEALSHKPNLVFVDEKNRITKVEMKEIHGQMG